MKTNFSNKPWPLLALLFLLNFGLSAQDQMAGQVLDADNHPLSYANVLLLNPVDSSLVAGNITDDKGAFHFTTVAPGNYLLHISMIGYQDYFSDQIQLVASQATHTFPTVILQDDAAMLGEVQVVEKRALFEQKIDRMVVNVANSITSAGSTALEVLKRSPGVSVNPQSNTISMSGKEGVVVMMNGKISRMPMDALIQLLAGMPSDNIEKIELIHTPPARFDAEGDAGFINIVLKKNQDEGLNGSFSVNAGYGKKEKAGANMNLNFRKNKINLFGDYSWSYNNNPQEFRNYRSFVKDDVLFETSSISDRDPTKLYVNNARIGLDLFLSDKTVVGGLVSWADRDWVMDAVNEVSNTQDKQIISRINIPNTEINHGYNLLSNINISHELAAGQNLNIDVDYAYFFNNNPSHYTNTFFDSNNDITKETQLRVSKTTPMNIWVGKVDYSNALNDALTIDMGVKGTSTSFDNNVLVEDLVQEQWQRSPDFSSIANMTEKIAAAYTSLNWKLTNRTDIKAGLRYEYTDVLLATAEKPNLVDRTYDNFFPSLFIANKINDNNSIQFSYSRRINRPSFRQLAPWFIFADPTTIETGNPTLQPSITDAVRATYTWKTVQVGFQYAYTDDMIGRFQPSVDLESNTQINGSKNLIDGQLVSSTISFPIKITDWWEFRSSWTGQWAQINDTINGEKVSFENASWQMNATTTLTLPRDFSIEVTGVYFSPSLFGAVVWQDFHTLDIGFQKVLKNDHGKLRFSVSDLFLGGNWLGRLDNEEVDFKYEGYYGFSERIFRLSYTRSFGNNKLKRQRQRATGAAEELQRTN